MRVVEPRIIRADGSILEDLNSRSGTIRPLGSLLRFKTLGGLNIRTHDRSSVLQSGPAGIATITVLFLVVFFTLQEASGTDGASLPARFRGDYENLRARFTNVIEKVEETRIGRGVVDAQELSEIARAAKSLSFEVKMFVSAKDAELHQSGAARLFHDGDTRMSERSALLGIFYACQAIETTLLVESEYQESPYHNYKPEFVQHIQEKYKEEWKLADQVVTKSGFGN